MKYPLVVLKPKRNASISRKHPWVFSGAIEKIILGESDEGLAEGDLVQICDHKEKAIAIGHFSENSSIAIRVLSFKSEPIDQNFWNEKIKKAYSLRLALGLAKNESTTSYRLVHAEGDGLPGLIIDIYKEVAVIQAHSLGIVKALDFIKTALQNVLGDAIKAIYSKSEKALHLEESSSTKDEYLYGDTAAPIVVEENGLKFEIDWINGQKTGFFIDQRESRKLLQEFSSGKKVLNTFCYSGGFSIYALAADAAMVHSVDSSENAIELTERNISLNFNKDAAHKSFTKDTLKYLNETEERYDVIILDPPAYAKSRSAMHKAVQGYKRLNEKALKVINSGGILFTFSCSQIIQRKLFEDTITAAAISAGRTVKVLYHLSQPADHPVNIFHPEGEYLKGLVLFVE